MNFSGKEFQPITTATIPNSLQFDNFYKGYLKDIDPVEFGNIEFAFLLAKVAHGGRFRQSGEPFFSHPLMCAQYYIEAGGRNPDIIISTLLHDTQEDSFGFLVTKGSKLTKDENPNFSDNWNLDDDDLKAEALLFRQFKPEIITNIATVTRISAIDESEQSKAKADKAYYEQIKNGPPEAQLIKMVDVLHNNRTLPSNDIDRVRRKIDETKKWYLPIFSETANHFPIPGKRLYWLIELEINRLEEDLKTPSPN